MHLVHIVCEIMVDGKFNYNLSPICREKGQFLAISFFLSLFIIYFLFIYYVFIYLYIYLSINDLRNQYGE
jgi:hypothetical protein